MSFTLLQSLPQRFEQIRTLARQIGSKLHLSAGETLTPPTNETRDHMRFQDATQAFRSWRCKQTQWWYFTGHLKAKSGRRFAYELTFFERKTHWDFIGVVPSRLVRPRLFVAHFAVSDIENPKAENRFRYWDRGGYLEKTGWASEETFHVEVGGWSAFQDDTGTIFLNASVEGCTANFQLRPTKDLTYHCQSGFSPRSHDPDIASFYCTHTRLETTGRLFLDDELFEVSGLSWMDHEKLLLDTERFENGWIWYSIQLASGDELMVYFLKDKHGNFDSTFSAGSWIDPLGNVAHLQFEDCQWESIGHWESPKSGARYPVHTKLSIPKLQCEIEIHPLIPNSELDVTRSSFVTYWEGATDVTGSFQGQPVTGHGFLELLGFDQRRRTKLVQFLFQPEPHKVA